MDAIEDMIMEVSQNQDKECSRYLTEQLEKEEALCVQDSKSCVDVSCPRLCHKIGANDLEKSRECSLRFTTVLLGLDHLR